jgi:hypothetical protein
LELKRYDQRLGYPHEAPHEKQPKTPSAARLPISQSDIPHVPNAARLPVLLGIECPRGHGMSAVV